jgi:flagellar motor switch protein FliN/FliY
MRLAKIPEAVGSGHWFVQAWAEALRDVVELLDMRGEEDALEVRIQEAEPRRWAAWSEPLWHSAQWSPGEGARLWLGCPAPVPSALWRRIGREEGQDAGEELETFREILNRSASGAAAEATSRLGEMAQALAMEPSPAPESGWAVEMRFRAGGEECVLALAGNVAMARALQPSPPKDGAATPEQSAAAAAAPDPFELIREVNLELAVSFGDTTMPLAEVLNLATGAIIELNRSVADPVELLVNDSVIARGEVVVVDGNYGVRITQIVSRRERVRSML